MIKNNETIIIEMAAELANKNSLQNITMKMIADELHIKPPALYKHIVSFDEVKRKLMLYGWKQMGERISSLPIKESFDMALEIMIEGMKSLEKREV